MKATWPWPVRTPEEIADWLSVTDGPKFWDGVDVTEFVRAGRQRLFHLAPEADDYNALSARVSYVAHALPQYLLRWHARDVSLVDDALAVLWSNALTPANLPPR